MTRFCSATCAAALVLTLGGCTRFEARRNAEEVDREANGAAYKAGKAAHRLADETKDAAQVVGKKLNNAAKDMKEGWKDAKDAKESSK